SSGVQPSSLARTLFMKGAYCARQASANAAQSTPGTRLLQRASPSAMMLPRQSTTVPKTSKTQALTVDGSNAVVIMGLRPDIAGCVQDQLQLAPLIIVGKQVALGDGRKSALRAKGQ